MTGPCCRQNRQVRRRNKYRAGRERGHYLLVDRLSDDVEDSAQGAGAYGDHDGRAGVLHGLAAHETCSRAKYLTQPRTRDAAEIRTLGGFHGNSSDGVLTQVLSDLRHRGHIRLATARVIVLAGAAPRALGGGRRGPHRPPGRSGSGAAGPRTARKNSADHSEITGHQNQRKMQGGKLTLTSTTAPIT